MAIRQGGEMKIEILKCDLCHSEFRCDVANNYREVGAIKLDMKACYHLQTSWEKEVCTTCSYKIRDAINKVMKELYVELPKSK